MLKLTIFFVWEHKIFCMWRRFYFVFMDENYYMNGWKKMSLHTKKKHMYHFRMWGQNWIICTYNYVHMFGFWNMVFDLVRFSCVWVNHFRLIWWFLIVQCNDLYFRMIIHLTYRPPWWNFLYVYNIYFVCLMTQYFRLYRRFELIITDDFWLYNVMIYTFVWSYILHIVRHDDIFCMFITYILYVWWHIFSSVQTIWIHHNRWLVSCVQVSIFMCWGIRNFRVIVCFKSTKQTFVFVLLVDCYCVTFI